LNIVSFVVFVLFTFDDVENESAYRERKWKDKIGHKTEGNSFSRFRLYSSVRCEISNYPSSIKFNCHVILNLCWTLWQQISQVATN